MTPHRKGNASARAQHGDRGRLRSYEYIMEIDGILAFALKLFWDGRISESRDGPGRSIRDGSKR